MCTSFKIKLKEAISTLKKKFAQVNLLTISLKNPDLDKKFVEQDRHLLQERAKVHLVFNLFLVLISPGYFFSSFETFTYILGLGLGTMLSVGICLGLSRFRLAAIECVLILTPMARALVKFITHNIAEKRFI